MEVTVCCQRNKEQFLFPLTVSRSQTVTDLKSAIAQELGHDMTQYSVIISGKVIESGALANFDIVQETHIKVVKKRANVNDSPSLEPNPINYAPVFVSGEILHSNKNDAIVYCTQPGHNVSFAFFYS